MSANPVRRVNKWPVLTNCFETASDCYLQRDLPNTLRAFE